MPHSLDISKRWSNQLFIPGICPMHLTIMHLMVLIKRGRELFLPQSGRSGSYCPFWQDSFWLLDCDYGLLANMWWRLWAGRLPNITWRWIWQINSKLLCTASKILQSVHFGWRESSYIYWRAWTEKRHRMTKGTLHTVQKMRVLGSTVTEDKERDHTCFCNPSSCLIV